MTNEEINNLRDTLAILPEGWQDGYSEKHFNYFCELKVLYKRASLDDAYAFENSYEELKDWLDRGYVIVRKATDDWFIFHTYRLTLAKE